MAPEFGGLLSYVSSHKLESYENCGCLEAQHEECDYCSKVSARVTARIEKADALFSRELAWLCDYSLRITTDHGRATSRLGEVEWALAMCRVAVQTVVSGISSNSTPDTVSVLFESVCSELKTLRAERNCKS